MFTTIGAVLQGPLSQGGRGTACPPVRAGARLVGRCEAAFWRATDRREVQRVVLAARRYELTGRERGRARGPLGHVGLEVLELLGNLVSHRTGRLEPSLGYLMAKLKRSKDAVVRALKALRAHGFLDWLTRYEPTGVTEGPGPRVRQASNAYRLSLPARAARLLGRLMQAPPVPDDAVQEAQERDMLRREHRSSLPLAELARFEVEDTGLGAALASLGQRVATRAAERAAQDQGPCGASDGA